MNGHGGNITKLNNDAWGVVRALIESEDSQSLLTLKLWPDFAHLSSVLWDQRQHLSGSYEKLKECTQQLLRLIQAFSFQSFSAALTNYFLPFLTLTAQLPYSTGGYFTDILAFSMAVGSPAMATYSLSITIMNRAAVRARFDALLKEARIFDEQNGGRNPGYADRIRAARILLQEGQQVPLRASEVDGWFSSLLTCAENKEWWERLEVSLKATRRGVTTTLVAQTSLAVIAFICTGRYFSLTLSIVAPRERVNNTFAHRLYRAREAAPDCQIVLSLRILWLDKGQIPQLIVLYK